MGDIAYMNGWDYLPSAANNNLRPFFAADGYFGATFGGGGDGLYPVPGRFGIGTALALGGPPGGTNAILALDHRFGIAGGSEGWIFGFALLNNSSGHTFRFYDGVTDTHPIQYSINSNGVLVVTIGAVTYRSRTGMMRNNAYQFVQTKLTPTVFRVLVNGELAINVGTPPAVAPFDSFRFSSGFNSGETRFDDLYLIDLDLAGPYSDFLGNVVVRSQLPTANGSVIQMVPNGLASNWQNVASPVLDAANYNSTDVVTEYDLYVMNPNASARDIFGIQVKGSFAQDNGIQVYSANRIKTGGTEFTGTQFGTPQLPGYSTFSNYWSLNPDTTVAWTNSDLNTLEAGPVLAASD